MIFFRQPRLANWLTLILFLTFTPISLYAQTKTKLPADQFYYNGDRMVPVWFANELIAILEPADGDPAASLTAEQAQSLLPGSSVTQTTDFGSVLQLPDGMTAEELLDTSNIITRTTNRYAAVYWSDAEQNGPVIIQPGELVIFAEDGVTKQELDDVVLKRDRVSFLESLIDGKAYLYSCPSDTSCLDTANELNNLSAVKHAYPNWIKFNSLRQATREKLTSATGIDPSERLTITDPLFVDQWHLTNTGQNGGTVGEDANIQGAFDLQYSGQFNSRTVINIVDDGLELSHEDLAGNINLADDHIDLRDGDADPAPEARDEHGTAVAGIAGSDGFNGLGGTGAAPDTTLIGIRLIGGGATDVQEAQAILHNLSNSDDYPDVSNNSWGPFDNGNLYTPGPLMLAAFENAVTDGRPVNGANRGLNIIWAGGNGLRSDDNSNYDGYANTRYTISVAASNNLGSQSYYSEPGANVLVNAPSSGNGVGTTTTDLSAAGEGYDSTSAYTNSFGGTSSASPLVAGIVALMLDANPNLFWRDVQKILAVSAQQNDPNDADWSTNAAGHLVNHKYGFGRVDATAAVNAALTWTNMDAEVSASNNLNPGTPIPDFGGEPAVVSIPISDSINIQHVYLTIDSDHSNWGDLEMTLTSPSGTQSVLSTTHSNGGAKLNGGFTFSSMRHLDEDSNGTWTLEVSDGKSGDVGNIVSVTLEVFGENINACTAPTDIGPVATSTLANGSTNLVWDNTNCEYWVYAGTSRGSNAYDNSGSIGNSTSYTFSGYPSDGSTVFVTLYYRPLTGGAWQSTEVTYTTPTGMACTLPTNITPATDDTLSGTSQLLSWDNTNCEYWVYAGTSDGSNAYNSSGSIGNSTSYTFSGYPSDGSTVFVTLYYRPLSGGAWQSTVVTYTTPTGMACTIPTNISPATGDTLSGTSQLLSWDNTNCEYWVYAGVAAGTPTYDDSGSLGNATSYTFGGYPSDGSSVFVTLYYRSLAGGVWSSVVQGYTAP